MVSENFILFINVLYRGLTSPLVPNTARHSTIQHRTTRCKQVASLLAVLAVITSPLVAATSDNPRIGKWKMNVAKSIFNDGPAPRSEVQVCEPVDARTIRLNITRVDAQGHESRREYTAHYDGKDYPFPGSPWDTIALKRLDRFRSEAVFKKQNVVVLRSTITVSKHGRVLTLRATTPDGRVAHIEVFDRQ